MRHGGSRFPDNVTPGDRDRLHRGDSGTTPGDWHSEGGERAGDRVMVDEPTSVQNTTYVTQKNGFFFNQLHITDTDQKIRSQSYRTQLTKV